MAIFRSNRYMYAQLIDDDKSVTIASAKAEKKSSAAAKVGETIAKKALDMKIKKVVFDRGGFGYKGRVRALAEGARKAGLKF